MKIILSIFFFIISTYFFNLQAEVPQASFAMPMDPVIVMQTNQGEIELRLFPAVAPLAVENFLRLAESGYYNNTVFHRLEKDFVIQGGDPKGTGFGGKSIWGTPFANEVHPSVNFDRPGLLAMANAGPHTNNSQFFITLDQARWLDGKYTIFGEVIRGFEVVEKINKAPRKWFQPSKSSEPQIIYKILIRQ